MIKNIPILVKKGYLFIKDKFSKLKFRDEKKKLKVKKKKIESIELKKKNKNKKEIIKEEIVDNTLVWNKSDVFKTNNMKPLRSLTGRVLPSTFLKGDRKIRKTFYLKEALIFMIILTLFDFIGFYRIKMIDMLHIFDNSIWNIVLTVTLTLLITFIGSYVIDYFVTEITLRHRKRKR